MSSYFLSDGDPIETGEIVASSGEATVYRLPDEPDLLFKCYHDADTRRDSKLERMLESPPRDPSLNPHHRSFAWPIEAVLDASGNLAGVLVREVPNARTLAALSAPKLRRAKAPEIDGYHLHAVGANLAFALSLLHDQGIVVGDLKPENILVDERALVTLIDCDSFQIPGRDEAPLHHCPVGSEGMTPPEWIGRDFGRTARHETSDRFGLAVLLFQLLVGVHPWNGTWTGDGEPPPRDQLIASGDWPYRPGAKLAPPPGSLPLDALSPDLAALFRRAFIEGHDAPDARPDAADWHVALCEAMTELEPCEGDGAHFRVPGTAPCPWCVLGQQSGVMLFGDPAGHRDPFAPLTLAYERALARGDARMAHELWRDNRCLREHPAMMRHTDRMTTLCAAMKAFDRWAALYKADPTDSVGLIAAWEADPALSAEAAVLDEAIDGQNALGLITRLRDRSLAIPRAPIEMDTDCQDDDPADGPADSPLQIRYRVVPGWYGLRPARLRLDVPGKTRLPGFEIVDRTSGLSLGRIKPMTAQGRTEIPFDQPAWRACVSLIPIENEGTRHVAMIDPPAREATIGAPAAAPKPGRPRRNRALLHA